MCGICGTAGFADERVIISMTEAIHHRGPDDGGVYVSPDHVVSLGNRRLAILDLSVAGHMPMSNDSGTMWLTYNGEVYNFRELRRDLEARGHRFRSDGDTEVVLRGYEAWGLGVLSRLKGMFAFALWDAAKRELVLARDRFGIKPLYYYAGGNELVFASEIKSIWRSRRPSPVLNPESVHAYLIHTWVPGPETVLRDVRRLSPAHVLVWKSGRFDITPYYVPPAPRTTLRDEREDIDEFRGLFDAAVERHLVSDVPVGIFASGGVDSTAILDAAARKTPGVDAYTIEYEADAGRWEQSDEDARFAQLTAARYGARHHRIILKPDVATLLPAVAAHMDEPVADTAAVSALLICRAAKPTATVLLSGMGADELLAGYSVYRAFALAQMLSHIPPVLRNRLLLPLVRTLRHARHAAPIMRPGLLLAVQRFAEKLFLNADASREALYLSYRSWGGTPTEMAALLAPELRAAVRDTSPYRRQWELFERAKDCDWLSRLLMVEAQTFLPDLNLLYSDKMSMAASVELRVPFLDSDLADFVFSLPPDLKLKGRVTKYILRRAMEGRIPTSVLRRRKAPFASPMRYWFRNDLREMLQDRLSSSEIRSRGVFDPDRVSAVLAAYLAGEHDNVHLIYALLHFQLWQDATDHARRAVAA
jgi:asparagine synthase (glutamine-hydrolysing)